VGVAVLAVTIKLILDDGQQVAPVILLEIAKNPQCYLNVLVGFLTLSICLRMVYACHLLLHFQQLTDLFEDFRGESSIPV